MTYQDLFYYSFLICLAAYCLRALKHPGVAITLLICMQVIKQALQVRFVEFSAQSSLTNILVGLIAASSLAISWQRGVKLFKPIDKMLILRISFSVLVWVSFLWKKHAVGFGDNMNTFLYVVVFVFLMPSLMRRESDVREFIWSFIWLGSIAALALYFSADWANRSIAFAADPRLIRTNQYSTASVLGGNPLEVANLGLRLTVILILLNARNLGWFFTLVRWAIVALALAMILRSGSRGQVFVLFGVLLALIPFAKSFRTPGAMLGSMVVMAGVLALLYGAYSFALTNGRWNPDAVQKDAGVRTLFATQALQLWVSNPTAFFIGHGYDASFDQTYGLAFPEVGPAAMALDLGLAGIVLWVPMVYMGIRSWFRSYRLVKDDPVKRGYVACLGAIPLAFFLLSFKEAGYLFTPGYCALLTRYEDALRGELETTMPEPALADPELALLSGEMLAPA